MWNLQAPQLANFQERDWSSLFAFCLQAVLSIFKIFCFSTGLLDVLQYLLVNPLTKRLLEAYTCEALSCCNNYNNFSCVKLCCPNHWKSLENSEPIGSFHVFTGYVYRIYQSVTLQIERVIFILVIDERVRRRERDLNWVQTLHHALENVIENMHWVDGCNCVCLLCVTGGVG